MGRHVGSMYFQSSKTPLDLLRDNHCYHHRKRWAYMIDRQKINPQNPTTGGWGQKIPKPTHTPAQWRPNQAVSNRACFTYKHADWCLSIFRKIQPPSKFLHEEGGSLKEFEGFTLKQYGHSMAFEFLWCSYIRFLRLSNTLLLYHHKTINWCRMQMHY